MSPTIAIRAAALLTALVPLAACGSSRTASEAATEAPSECFDAGAISSYQPIDRETVLLRVGASAYYELKITGVCPDIDWSRDIGIQGETGSSICTGRDVTLVTPSHRGGTQECYANEIRRTAAPR